MKAIPAIDNNFFGVLHMAWLEGKVAITFHTEKPHDAQDVIDSLRLNTLNAFLDQRGFVLQSSASSDIPSPFRSDNISDDTQNQDINDISGKYLFPSPSGRGTVAVCFFDIELQQEPHPIQDMRVRQQAGDCCQGESNTRQVVNLINHNLNLLRQEGKVPIIGAMPNWLGAGSHCIGDGSGCGPPIPNPGVCPITPGDWPIQLPDLDPESHPKTPLRSMTGENVTVFVLDTMPKLINDDKALLNLSNQSGKNNLLLQKMTKQMTGKQKPPIKKTYQKLPILLAENAKDQIVSGHDIYLRSYRFKMEDHGLAVTGIVRQLATGATIEYIRVLNDFGVLDTHTLINELQKIRTRMDQSVKEGGLRDVPVVINLSLVIAPSDEELVGVWFGDNSYSGADMFNKMREDILLLRIGLHMVIQSLTAAGAVIVAAAGNDSNTPEKPGRQSPRYPAAYPEVISVGAVNKCGNAASYSNYPALVPHHNGIATYGGERSKPVAKIPKGQPKPAGVLGPDPYTMTAAIDVDGVIGVYSSSRYPKLSDDDVKKDYPAPNKYDWAFWSGTSFATPMISAVAARVLQLIKSKSIPPANWSHEVQRAITTAAGQQEYLTGDQPLSLQKEFTQGSGVGVSLLRAYQCAEPDDCQDNSEEENTIVQEI